MASRSSLQRQVASAFRAAGGLADVATFTNNPETTGYNFSTRSRTTAAEEVESTSIRIVFLNQTKASTDGAPYIATAVCQSANVEDIDKYDTMSFRGERWNVISIDDNGYTATITFSREV